MDEQKRLAVALDMAECLWRQKIVEEEMKVREYEDLRYMSARRVEQLREGLEEYRVSLFGNKSVSTRRGGETKTEPGITTTTGDTSDGSV